MPDTPRREFLKQASLGAAAIATTQSARVVQADDDQQRPPVEAQSKLVMGWIGCGGQATNLMKTFITQPDVAVAYVCDPEAARAAAMAQIVKEASGEAPKIVADMRNVLDDKSVDAVCIATPDHWHAPATILACDAGKHVYVEKPCSHNIREGRLMIDAARRNNRIVQVGTQSRSSPAVIEAMQLLHDGEIGEVLVGKVWNSQRRRDIGHGTPGPQPDGLDYDLWIGPAPLVPFQANRIHYGWHWWYDFGTGDMGNDGVHDIDIARWGLGVDTHPSIVTASGGKFYFDDDQQFPDTQYVVFDYPGDGRVGHRKQIIFEQRIWSPYRQESYENGNAFYGTEGMLLLGKGDGWKLFGPKNELRKSGERSGMGLPHYRDFIDAVRTDRRPHADVEIAHLSTSLCHLGNIATRLGRTLHFDPASEQFENDAEANTLVKRQYRNHWATPRNV
ncbi:MAG TPA: Gfo/Idh/MocA family oxidoreductase [Pirellulales bacterium]|jgi:predicted dehydrogenase